VAMTEMLTHVERHEYDALVMLLLNAISVLKRAGADFAVIASNTPHIVYDTVNARSPLPLISIVEETRRKATALGLKKLLLTGTAFTMRSGFYSDCFAKYGLELVVPSPPEQREIHGIIFPDLENGIVDPAKKARFVGLCSDIIGREGLDGIILGCTELPLIAGDSDFNVPVLDTARIHIESIVSQITGKC
jgi:aspartate racemase